jgi:tetratricopeptide (TPR) repeat protein
MTLHALLRPERYVLPQSDADEILTLAFDSLSPHLQQELSDCRGRSRSELLRELVNRRLEHGDESLPQFAQLIRGLLGFEVAERLTIRQALLDPTFSRIDPSAEPGIRERLKELVQSLPPTQAAPQPHRERASPYLLSPQHKPLPHFANYIQRPDLESELRERLLSGASTIALQGAPGTGKTQLMTRVFHDSAVQDYFGLMLWFRSADSALQLELQYVALAKELGLAGDSEKFEEVFPKIQSFLDSQAKPSLIVFDNADNPQLLTPYLPLSGQVVVTSRVSGWDETIPIGPLAAEDAQLLVARLLRRLDPLAEKLCETLDHLPLGIVQACAFIRNRHFSIFDYLRLFERSPTLLTREERQDGHRDLPYSIQRLYEITFTALKEEGALVCLHRLACLSPDHISQEMIDSIFDDGSQLVFGVGHSSVDDWEPAPQRPQQMLIDYAILQPQSAASYGIHRLPRRVLREQLVTIRLESDSEYHMMMPTYGGDVTRVHNANPATTTVTYNGQGITETVTQPDLVNAMMVAMDALHQRHTKSPPSEDDISTNRQLLKHGEAVLALGKTFSPLPASLRTGIAQTMAWMAEEHLRVGEPHKAEPLLDDLVLLARVMKNKGVAMAGHLLTSAGGVWLRLGENKKALSLFQHTQEIYTEQFGEDHELVAGCIYNQGLAWMRLQNQDNARECFLIAREVYRALELKENGAALCLEELASLHLKRGDFLSTADLLQEAVVVRSAIDPNDPSIADHLHQIGNCFVALRRYHEALAPHARALILRVMQWEADHAGFANLFEMIAEATSGLGQHQLAVSFLKSAVRIELKAYGPCDERTGSVMEDLGLAEDRAGNRIKAIQCLQQAIGIYSQVSSDATSDLARLQNRLGIFLHLEKRYLGALNSHMEALALRKRLYGQVHPLVAESLQELTRASFMLNQGQQGVDHWIEASRIVKALSAPPDQAFIRHTLGFALMFTLANPQPQLAARLYHEARSLLKILHGDCHEEVADCCEKLADVLDSSDQQARGEKYRTEARAIRQQLAGYPDAKSSPTLRMSTESDASIPSTNPVPLPTTESSDSSDADPSPPASTSPTSSVEITPLAPARRNRNRCCSDRCQIS